jgi:hypothetical protein
VKVIVKCFVKSRKEFRNVFVSNIVWKRRDCDKQTIKVARKFLLIISVLLSYFTKHNVPNVNASSFDGTIHCEYCQGTGRVFSKEDSIRNVFSREGLWDRAKLEDCPSCNGTGYKKHPPARSDNT